MQIFLTECLNQEIQSRVSLKVILVYVFRIFGYGSFLAKSNLN